MEKKFLYRVICEDTDIKETSSLSNDKIFLNHNKNIDTQTSDIPQMRTINEIAEEFNISSYFVRQLCIKNKIVFVKSGSKYLINKQLFIRYLNGEN